MVGQTRQAGAIELTAEMLAAGARRLEDYYGETPAHSDYAARQIFKQMLSASGVRLIERDKEPSLD